MMQHILMSKRNSHIFYYKMSTVGKYRQLKFDCFVSL